MLRDRRFFKPVLALIAVAAIGLVVSGCAFIKPGSLTASQPQGVGSVRVHFDFCTVGKEEFCGASDEEDVTVQYLAGFAVPPGSTPPATFTATPTKGGPSVVFTRNDEVASEMAASSAALQNALAGASPKELEEFASAKEVIGSAWPPAGLQGVGYLSAPVFEPEGGNFEWSADADFGLPSAADGGPFAGPFTTAIAWGLRRGAKGATPAGPVHCIRLEEGAEAKTTDAFCTGSVQQVQLGTSDLKITAPKNPVPVFLGGSAQISFPLKFAGSPTTVPSFALSATTTAKGGKTKLASKSFTPGAANATSKVTVTVPPKAKPKTYTVTLTATTPQGGTATQVAKLKVTKPKLKLGSAKADAAKGFATLKVTIPGAGKLTIGGKGVKTVKKKSKSKKKKTLKVKIQATGSTAAALGATGSAKVKVKATFKPTSGISVKKTKSVVLKLG